MIKRFSLAIPALLLVLVCFWLPSATLIRVGLSSGLNWPTGTSRILAFTVGQALLTVVVCLVLAAPVTQLLYRRSFRGAATMRSLAVVPFVLPTVVAGIMFRPVQRTMSEWVPGIPLWVWVVVLHVFYNLPLVVRVIGSAWSALDRTTEDEAQVAGASGWQVLRLIVLPQLRPSVIAAASLAFLFSVTSFGAVLLVGSGRVRTIETQIWVAATQYLDLPTAATLAIVQTVLTALAFLLADRFASSALGQMAGGWQSGHLPRLKKSDATLVTIAGSVLALLYALPILGLLNAAIHAVAVLAEPNSWQVVADTLGYPIWFAVLRSLRNVVVVLVLVGPIGLAAAWAIARERQLRWLQPLTSIPLGVSAVVIGFGYLLTNWPLRGSWVLVPLAQSVVALPFVIRLAVPAFAAVDSELRDAAMNSGADTWGIFRWVDFGVGRPVLGAALGLAAVTSLGEFGAAAFLAVGDRATLPVALYRLMSRPGAENYSAAVLIAVLYVGLAALLSRSRQDG